MKFQVVDVPQPPRLTSGWSLVVKGKQSQSVGKTSGKHAAGSKTEKPDRTMSDAATEASQATSASSHASPVKAKHSSSEASSSSSSGASKESMSTQGEQQAEVHKPKKQLTASRSTDVAAESPQQGTTGASGSDAAEVRCIAWCCLLLDVGHRRGCSRDCMCSQLLKVWSLACCRRTKRTHRNPRMHLLQLNQPGIRYSPAMCPRQHHPDWSAACSSQ